MKPKPTLRDYMRFFISVLSIASLAACSNSPLGPNEHAASMHVSASAVTATALGQSVQIQASVTDASGKAIADASIHWDVSATDVLEPIGDGRFRVLKEGSARVAAIWPKDPSVRAAVTVNVDAGLLASACISKSDQATDGAAPKCAQQRVVVRTAPVPATVVASSSSH
jgi:hypothetical protein